MILSKSGRMPARARLVFRYEKFWLPLLAEISTSPETDLAWCPPVDVHWVWHTHMLAPVTYNMDCQAITGRLMGHKPRSRRVIGSRRIDGPRPSFAQAI